MLKYDLHPRAQVHKKKLSPSIEEQIEWDDNDVNSSQVVGVDSIILKQLGQPVNLSYSVFTKQKVSLQKGLYLRAAVSVALGSDNNSDGVAIIIQNHKDGSNYIGEHGLYLGLKSNSDCALTIKFQSKNIFEINFNNKQIYTNDEGFYNFNHLQIYLQIQILESGDAKLYLKLSSNSYTFGPSQPLILTNFRKGLCLNESEELSAFVGFSSSQHDSSCSHQTTLDLFKMNEYNCSCPLSPYFPLEIKYKQDYSNLPAYQDNSVQIEPPNICGKCEGLQDKSIYLQINQIWKITGQQMQSQDNVKYIEFKLPQLPVNVNHLMSIIIGDLSVGQTQFKISQNDFILQNWKIPYVAASSNSSGGNQQPLLPLTGFRNNKPTQPPSIPPLEDQVLETLNQQQSKFYTVDVYSRPIIQSKSDNQLLQQSTQRIKVDTIKVPIEDSAKCMQVKSWIPTQEIKLDTNQYKLMGQNYEYEIKSSEGTLVSKVLSKSEVFLDTLYDGVCYGNYCQSSVFCNKESEETAQPVSELDQVCKEMEENPIGKAGTYIEAADIVNDELEEGRKIFSKGFMKKLDKILKINELYYLTKAIAAKCPENDKKCNLAKAYLVGKYIANTYTVIGEINFFLDLFNELSDLGYYLASQVGKWISSKFTGDPHITNLDGCKFDFQGQGEYVLVQEKMIGFAVHTRFLQSPLFKSVTTIRSIAIRGFWGSPVVYIESLVDEEAPLVRVNGLIVNFDGQNSYEIPNLSISVNGDSYQIKYSNYIELLVINHGQGILWTGIPRIYGPYSTQLQGILGNGDSVDDEKDFQSGSNIQDGYQTIKSCKDKDDESIWKFGQSWRLTKKEDSILYYKKDENPDSFYDKNWKPQSTGQILNQFNQVQLNDAKQKCKQNQNNQDDCILDLLLLQGQSETFTKVLNAYNNPVQLPEQNNVILAFKNVNETSVELVISLGSTLQQSCSTNCQLEILYQQDDPNVFYRMSSERVQFKQINSKVLTDLDKKSQYTFYARVSSQYQSNKVNIYTNNPQCLPFCAKKNACGDDGCGGQCNQNNKCNSQCIFGVCEMKEIMDNSKSDHNQDGGSDSDSNKLSTVAIVFITITAFAIVIILAFIAIRKWKQKQGKKTENISSDKEDKEQSIKGIDMPKLN
ncbi:hypothetical protein ABPG74_001579 [Tetrahymena malaccensis]